MDNFSQYKTLYLKTAYEYLSKIEDGLSKALKNPNSEEIVENLYIDIHSLRGQSNAMGYESTAKLCNIVEEKLREIRENKNFGELGSIKETVERIKKSVENLDAQKGSNL